MTTAQIKSMKPTSILLGSVALHFFDAIQLSRCAGTFQAWVWAALVLLNVGVVLLAVKEVAR